MLNSEMKKLVVLLVAYVSAWTHTVTVPSHVQYFRQTLIYTGGIKNLWSYFIRFLYKKFGAQEG
jgi:hypothetical protein